MNQLSKTILEKHLKRKTKKQKADFVALLREHFPEMQEEVGGSTKSRNLLFGDLETAKVVLTAHYDTSPLSMLPNIIMPHRKVLKFFYSMLSVLPYIAALLLAYWGALALGATQQMSLLAGLAVYYLLYFGKFYAGLPNPKNFNDNTSGVIALLEAYTAMTELQRSRTAVVLFDNEEYGCVGSSWFYKQHKPLMDQKLLVNFDCVGDGDHFLLVRSNELPEAWDSALRQAFLPEDGHAIVFDTAKNANHSSDHKHFKYFLSVLAACDHPLLGLHTGRIHTPKDTVLDMENIHYLSVAIQRLTNFI